MAKTIKGTARADRMLGSIGDDILNGDRGDDTLIGAGGDDLLYGGSGNDRFILGAGNSTIHGGAGLDTVVFSDMAGGIRLNLALGLLEDDGAGHVWQISEVELAEGTFRADVMMAAASTVSLAGGGGNDHLIGHVSARALTFLPGSGDDTVEGLGLYDTVSYAEGATDLPWPDGTESPMGGVLADLGAGLATDMWGGHDVLIGIENIVGSLGHDTLTGSTGNNVMQGGEGDDMLDGAGGTDILIGGLGDDIYRTDGGDKIIETAGGGHDTVISTVSTTLGAHLEDLVLEGAAAKGVGNNLDNVIAGNAAANNLNGAGGDDILRGYNGNDILMGGTGADTLVGGAGRDQLYGGSDVAADYFVFQSAAESQAGAKRDLVHDFVSGIDKIDLRAIDADMLVAGHQSLVFARGPAAHSVWQVQTGKHVLLQADLNGDGRADFEVNITKTGLLALEDVLL